jgi:hypothetical protein
MNSDHAMCRIWSKIIHVKVNLEKDGLGLLGEECEVVSHCDGRVATEVQNCQEWKCQRKKLIDWNFNQVYRILCEQWLRPVCWWIEWPENRNHDLDKWLWSILRYFVSEQHSESNGISPIKSISSNPSFDVHIHHEITWLAFRRLRLSTTDRHDRWKMRYLRNVFVNNKKSNSVIGRLRPPGLSWDTGCESDF